MDKKYQRMMLGSGMLSLLGTAFCVMYPSAWVLVAAPIVAIFWVAFFWSTLAKLVLCKNPQRLLKKPFTRCLFCTLCVPFWFSITTALLSMAPPVPQGQENLVDALGVLVVLVGVVVIPLIFLVCMVIAIRAGIQHLKQTPQTETRIYRDGPLLLAALIGVVAVTVLLVLLFLFLT